jgi:hypothetical protein
LGRRWSRVRFVPEEVRAVVSLGFTNRVRPAVYFVPSTLSFFERAFSPSGSSGASGGFFEKSKSASVRPIASPPLSPVCDSAGRGSFCDIVVEWCGEVRPPSPIYSVG